MAELLAAWDFEFVGVKKRVKRRGVMGGGFFCLQLAVVADGTGGDDERISRSGVGSWRISRNVQGDDISSMIRLRGNQQYERLCRPRLTLRRLGHARKNM